jgi:Do/DeqQ family serine protease
MLTVLLLVVTGALSVKGFFPTTAGADTAQLAVVNIDNTPLDRANPARVTSYADVLDEVRPAVVSVFSSRVVRQRQWQHPFGDDPFFRRFFGVPEGQEREQRRQGLGSGVIISDNGYILTNNHVIEGADEVRVALSDQREFTAKVVGTDPKTDVAVLKIEADHLPSAALTDSDGIRVGDIVFALGNPLGVGQTVTMGIVSATGRQQIGILGHGGYENFIQTDAAINQGNSGGPLVDGDGRVIGINTAILSRTGGNIGIGFAIPVNLVANVMESLIQTGTVERGYLGVNIQPLSPELAEDFNIPEGRGALINDVVPDSPAAQAGLQRGDVIVKVDEQRVSNHTALRLMISQMRPGSSPVVEFIRNGELQSVQVELGRLDDPGMAPRSRRGEFLEGVSVAPVTPELREQYELAEGLRGLVVTEVAPGSLYADSLPVGAVIVEINQRSVTTVAAAREALRQGRNILYINYRGAFQYISIPVE